MTDGTRLAIDIYRPDAPGKFPALVERTPYDKTKSSEIQVGAHTFFAERGYVFLVQDTRGRFASEGTFYPFLDDAGCATVTATTPCSGSRSSRGRTARSACWAAPTRVRPHT